MGEKEPKKKPLVMDAVKPQSFPGPSEETLEEKELDEIEAAVAKEAAQEKDVVPADEPKEETTEETENIEQPAAEEPATEPEEITKTESEKPSDTQEPESEATAPTINGLEDEQPKTEKPTKNVNSPSFAEQIELTHDQSKKPTDPPTASPKKEHIAFKIIRIIIWLLVAIMLPVGIYIIRNSEKITAYANGTHYAQLSFGQIVFWSALVVGVLNFIWGVTRWVLRVVRNHYGVGRIIGKLIGGGAWRLLTFVLIITASFIFVAPMINNKIRADAFDQSKSSKNEVIYCGGICTEKLSIEPASPKQFYLSTLDSTNTEVTVHAPISTSVTIYKAGGDSDQQLTKGNGKVTYTSGSEVENIIITLEDDSLDSVEFVVSIMPEEIREISKEQKIDFNSKNPFKKIKNS